MLFDSAVSGRRRIELARAATLIGYDAISAFCGLYLALLAGQRFEGALDPAVRYWHVAPVLILLRVGAGLAMRLHRWSFASGGSRYGLRFVAAALTGSVSFAIAFPGLAPTVVVLEGLATLALMSALRLVPVVADLLVARRLPAAEADFVRRERARRVLNVVVAGVGLVITLPVWAIIAIAIKLTSRGPVFYMQERVGLDLRASQPHHDDPRRRVDLGGRPFMMFKFRTMRVDAESSTGAVWSGRGDPRVTPIGKFLRHCRLDELPQLLNVLKGDMNVVGPRPERAPIFAELRTRIPQYSSRQRARPGITGFAQVNLEYDASIEDVADKVLYDVAYVRNQSVFVDLYIMVKTLPVMLFRERVLRARERREATPAAEPQAVENLVRTQG